MHSDTKAGWLVVGVLLAGVLVIVVMFPIADSIRAEQGPPKWRHWHYRYGVRETCDLQTCAPKGSKFDE